MRHLFIINPSAGKSGSTDLLVRQIEALDLDAEIFYTRQSGDAQRITEEAAAQGIPLRVYACGGDGTLNEVVNGAAGHDHVAVTNVSKGTGNDFLKIFGPDAKRRFSDLRALSSGPQALFDVMNCNGRLGIGTICAGVDARIAADVHKYKRLPLVSGIGAYLLALVVNVLFKRLSQPMSITLGGQTRAGETVILCVCNGRYYGGGFMPVGEAMPDDGVLDVLVVPKVSRFTFFRFVSKYASGQYKKYPDLISDYHGGQISFSSSQELVAVVDGEVMRDRAFTVRLDQRKVWFFYPAGLSYEPSV
ncbi:MAG: BmrU protein [Oscillospiraceae bacterium]|nr:BmrU protein [Oscillospiraceae bacterium]